VRQTKFLSTAETFALSWRRFARAIRKSATVLCIAGDSLADQAVALTVAESRRSRPSIVEKARRFGKFL
jgi:hypothetical protein